MLLVVATALVLAAATAASAAALAAHWVTVHRVTIAVNVRRVAYRVLTPRLPRRLRRLAGFAGERLRPGGVFGLRMTAGLLAVAVLSVLFGAVLEDVTDGEGIALIDRPIARFVAAHRTSGLTTVMRTVSWVGGPLGVAVVALVCAGVVSVVRRSWSALVVVAAGTGGIAVIEVVLKAVVGRSRPPVQEAVATVAGYAFPSGHAASSTATLAALAYVATLGVHSTATRAATWAASAAGAALVGLSRVYLGVHWLSDVLGGMLIGALWAAVVITAWSTYQSDPEQLGMRRAQAARVPRSR